MRRKRAKGALPPQDGQRPGELVAPRLLVVGLCMIMSCIASDKCYISGEEAVMEFCDLSGDFYPETRLVIY